MASAGGHLVEDGRRVLGAGVVRGEDRRVGVLHGDVRHLGPLGAVAVAAAAAHHEHPLPRAPDLAQRPQHVFERIGRVGVIDHGGGAVVRTHVLEAPVHRAQRAQQAQHLLLRLAQQQRRGVDREQVARIEPPEQSGPHLAAVDAQQHAVGVLLHDLAAEVGRRAQREGADRGARVLHHHLAVAGERPAGQGVEERLLGPQVLREGLMVVEVVVREVGEDAAREVQAPDAVLHDGVRRALHEAVAAPGIDHLAEQGVEPDGVRRGVRGLGAARAHAVDDRRNEPRLVAQSPEQLVEERGRGGLAVGARNAHQLELAARVAVPRRGQVGHRGVRVLHLDVGHALVRRSGHALAHHGCGAALHRHVDVVVSVALRAADREEAVARLHAARIVDQVRHGPLRGTLDAAHGRRKK